MANLITEMEDKIEEEIHCNCAIYTNRHYISGYRGWLL